MSKIMEKATETSGFLDGREYTAAFLYEFFSLIVGNGVYVNELTPTAANDNMTITHGAGHAWINGVCYKNTIPFVLDIATADGVLNRYDSLMLRLNLSINEVYAIIVQGDYATNPTPPAVTRNHEIFDLKLCDIYIPAGCTKITQAQVTDTRLDTSVCGVPVFPVEHLDMTKFYRQIDTDLDELKTKEQAEILYLLERLNTLVSGDAVGQLLIELDAKAPLTHTEDKNNPHGVDAEQIGAVPTSRTVNGKSLSDDITLSAFDVNARPNTWTPTAEQVGARPNTWTPTAEQVGAAPTGYGLGGGATGKAVKSIEANGWYITNEDTPNSTWLLCHARVTNNGSDITVDAWNLSGTTRYKITKRSGTWGEWEFDIPLMSVGFEYRTTEKYKGKTVWTVLADLNTCPAGETIVNTSFTATEVVRWDGNDCVFESARNDKYLRTKRVSIVSGKLAITNIFGTQVGSSHEYCRIWYTKD